ncbi:MAG TPA: cytochrome c oxidase subunit II [Terracidiphilus sp.]|nr:cytochrome c oxidase subunit II [Terracidiphilus sp.]
MILVHVPGFPGNQTSLNPVGPGAERIEGEFALIFWITAIVYCLVLIALVVYVLRRRHSLNIMPEPMPTTPQSDRWAKVAVSGAMVVTVLLLFIMMIGSFVTGHALGNMNRETAYTIDVYGHQWWWEVHYPNDEPDKTVVTANEIHVPLGVPLRIHGTSRDVIHSFWAPNVQGKRDLMPGYETDVMMQIDQPGRWRGQCAEYCGEQHAHMSFYMVAEPGPQFQQWLSQQTASSVPPSTPQAVRGQQVFLGHACVMCHTVRGTPAGSRVGPDLTHVASRSTIAAGLLPNTIGNLGGWILNAQSIKPGCRMPPNHMTGSELQDLLAYLETLK